MCRMVYMHVPMYCYQQRSIVGAPKFENTVYAICICKSSVYMCTPDSAEPNPKRRKQWLSMFSPGLNCSPFNRFTALYSYFNPFSHSQPERHNTHNLSSTFTIKFHKTEICKLLVPLGPCQVHTP